MHKEDTNIKPLIVCSFAIFHCTHCNTGDLKDTLTAFPGSDVLL